MITLRRRSRRRAEMRIVTFASGSGGNCTLVSGGETHLLIDAGISMRRITRALRELGLTPQMLSGVLVTHEHGDHVAGLRTMTKQFSVPIYAPRTVANHLHWSIAGIDPVLHEIQPGTGYDIGDMCFAAFRTPHDTDMSVGYRIKSGEHIFAFSTDMGMVTNAVLRGLEGAETAVIEANHDVDMLLSGRYPYPLKRRILSDSGHLSNDSCAELAVHLARTGTSRIILGHLSQENNTPQTAFARVRRALDENGLSEVELYIAPACERLCVSF